MMTGGRFIIVPKAEGCHANRFRQVGATSLFACELTRLAEYEVSNIFMEPG